MVKMRHDLHQKRMTFQKQTLVGLFVLVTVILFSVLYILEVSARPFLQGRQYAEQVAQSYAGLSTITDVAFYNGETSYYSVSGQNEEDKELLVLIPEESSDILIYQADAGISKVTAGEIAQENGAEDIKKITFGYQNNQPIWEVYSDKGYYIISFEDGRLMSKEGI